MLTDALMSGWIVMATLLAVAGSRASSAEERTVGDVLGAVIAAVAGVGLLAVARGGDLLPQVPAEWVVVLQDGPGRTSIGAALGVIEHAGPGFEALLRWFDGAGPRDLRDVARLNLLLGVLDAGLILAVTARLAGSLVAGTIAAALLLACPWPFLSVRSDLATGAVTTCFLCGAVAVHWLGRSKGAWERGAAGALLVVAGALATSCRAEASVVALPAIVWTGAWLVWGDATVTRREEQAAAVLSRPGAWSAPVRRWVVGLLVLGGLFWPIAALHARLGWAWAGLYPPNPTALLLPLVLVGLVPAGVAVLASVGLVDGLRRPGALALLPLTTIVLFRTWFAAATGDPEPLLRYGTMLVPVALVLAAAGWPSIVRWAEGRWGRRGVPFVLAAAVVLSVPVLPPGTAARADGSNPTREARFLLRALEARPDCVLMTLRPSAHRWRDHDGTWEWLAFGGGMREPRSALQSGAPSALRRSLAPQATCTLFYAGLDCALVGADCSAHTGAPASLESAFPNAPWADGEHGEHAPTVRLSLHPL